MEQRTRLEGSQYHDRYERRRQGNEQPERGQRDHLYSGNVQQRARDHHRQSNPPSAISFLEPGKHSGQVGNEQGGIDRHVENGRHQREPGFLKSPEVAHGAAHPGVVAAFVGQRAGEFADHKSRRQAPEQRGEKKNQDGAPVAGAVHDVFGAIGSARHHKEGGGDQGPKREANESFPVGYWGERLGISELWTRGASCCQFLWLPPQATHSHHRVSPDVLLAAPGLERFPGISAKLVRKCEITGNLHRCKIFLRNIENFCKPPRGTEVTRSASAQSFSSQGSATRSVRLQLWCFSWLTNSKRAF